MGKEGQLGYYRELVTACRDALHGDARGIVGEFDRVVTELEPVAAHK
ncbi:MAG: hypothetical protein NVSMB22_28570 [Chloroflexota bacterium]